MLRILFLKLYMIPPKKGSGIFTIKIHFKATGVCEKLTAVNFFVT